MTTRRAHRHYLLAALGIAVALIVIFARRGTTPALSTEHGDGRAELTHVRLRHAVVSAPAAIHGSVHGPDGLAIEHARVCATRASANVMMTAVPACTNSGSDGRFALNEVPPGSYWVGATAEGFGPGRSTPAAVTVTPKSSLELTITLSSKGEALRGAVIDAAGGPVPRAEVRAIHWDSPPWVIAAQADDDGTFTLWLPAGAVTLTASAEGYAAASLDRVAPARGVEIVLAPGAAIEGVVQTRDGRAPVAGATVTAALAAASRMLQRTAQTDDEGRFRITELEPGSYELQVTAPGARGVGERWTSVELGETRRGVELWVDPALQVEGKVVIGSSGAPCTQGGMALGPPSPLALLRPATHLTAAQLEHARAAAPEPVSTLIESDGHVHFDAVLPGRYFVTVECSGHTLREGPELLVVHEDVRDLIWQVEPGLGLEVRTVDGRGQPAPGVTIWLEWPSKEGVPGAFMPMPMNMEGRYRIPDTLFPGRYVLRADRELRAEPSTVDLRDGMGTVPVTVRLQDSSELEVHVSTRDGADVEGLAVRAHIVAEGAIPAQTGVRARTATSMGSGRYRFSALQPASYRVEAGDGTSPAVHARFGAADTISVAPGAVHKVSLVYERGSAISGRVLEADGAAASDVWVSVSPATENADSQARLLRRPPEKRVLTDHEGRFRLAGLADGASFTVHAERPDGSAAANAENVPSNAQVELRLKQPASLQGRVLRPDHSPAPDYFLKAFAVEAGTLRSARFSESSGRFVLDGVPPGRVRLEVTNRTGQSASSEVTLEPGQELTELELVLAESRRSGSVPPSLRPL